jgi:hypothetical protein
MPIVLKSGCLNLLEPSGLVKACNETASPLPLHLYAFVTKAWQTTYYQPYTQLVKPLKSFTNGPALAAGNEINACKDMSLSASA